MYIHQVTFNYSIMKRFDPFLLTLVVFFNCHSINITQEDKVRGIIIERLEPDFHWDRLKNRYTFSNFTPFYTKIYYYKNQVLLQFNFEHRSLHFEGLNEHEKQKLADSTPYQIRYFSLIYSSNGNKGWRCDSNNVKSGRIVDKDSLLAGEWIGLQQKYDILKASYHTLVSSTNSKDGNITEEYRIKNKKDTTMTGTVVMVFSKKEFGLTEFSLAKETEDERKMKIIKMIVVTDARYVPPTNAHMERLEIPYELKELVITNERELIKMFEAAKAILH